MLVAYGECLGAVCFKFGIFWGYGYFTEMSTFDCSLWETGFMRF